MPQITTMNGDDERDRIRREVERLLGSSGSAFARFLVAALGGAVPVAGGAIGAAASAWGERDQQKVNELFSTWLRLQQDEIREIGVTLLEVAARIDLNDPAVKARAESPEFVALVRKAVRQWAGAESEEKRCLIRNLLANAASCRLTTDDVVKLFIEWIDKYSEVHFKVIRILFNHAGLTRRDIWNELHGERVREDSAEADLYSMVVHDLSLGGVIRQERETDAAGNFYKSATPRRRARNPLMKSRFDDEKPYELTALGQQFVHYTMNEIVPKLTAAPAGAATASVG